LLRVVVGLHGDRFPTPHRVDLVRTTDKRDMSNPCDYAE
jgi:hypothetical protein